jgi:hypothetical protein
LFLGGWGGLWLITGICPVCFLSGSPCFPAPWVDSDWRMVPQVLSVFWKLTGQICKSRCPGKPLIRWCPCIQNICGN